MKTTLRILTLSLGLMGLSLSSCKKDDDNESSLIQENLVAQDQMEANSAADDVQGTVQQFMDDNTALFGRVVVDDTIIRTRGIDDCATVTLIRSQKKITVDFGTSGCQGPHGRKRMGKWLISYTDFWKNQGSVITVNFENFKFTRPGQSEYISVNNTSSQTLTNLGFEGGIYEFKREFSMTSTLPSGLNRTHQGTRYITWNTNQTAYRFDDTFTIKTTSNEYGTERRGRAYEVSVLNPVVTKTECWLLGYFKPVSGIVRITKIGRAKTIDYGNGTCGGPISVQVEGGKKYAVGEGD